MSLAYLLTIVGLPLAVMVAAGWPLLVLPRVRAALLCTGGTCCMAGGTTLMGLLAGGVLAVPGLTQTAAAQEATPAAEVVSPPASANPFEPIEVTPPAPSDTKDDEIKIETRPDGTVIIPAGRPEWVLTPRRTMTGDVHAITVSSGPYTRAADAQRALDAELVKATEEYIAEQLGSQLAPALLRYDARSIKQRFVSPQNTYDEVITVSIGPMHQSHALVEFNRSFRDELSRNWDAVRATSRLTQMGLFAGGALLLLGSVFGYFRLDNATRGYYTGRLQFMAAAAILAIVGAGALLGRWITWL